MRDLMHLELILFDETKIYCVMGGTFFKFQQFEIQQKFSAMKVGTDGILLGAWTKVDGDERNVLDVGSGTGLIALMIAQRNEYAKVHAVEIEPLAAKEALGNVQNSPWADRVHVKQISFQDFVLNSTQKFDLIVSNPPYFNGSYKSVLAERTAARHVELLNHEDLIDGVVKLLEPVKGRFSAIFPYEVGAVFIANAASKKLFCNKITNIYPREGHTIKRLLAEFSLVRHDKVEQNSLAIENTCGYTNAFKELTGEFYLKF